MAKFILLDYGFEGALQSFKITWLNMPQECYKLVNTLKDVSAVSAKIG
jgi:hypothetical protein